MATTPVFITGFEWGMTTLYNTGGGLADSITGGCTVVGASSSIGPHTGNYLLKCTATSGALAYISRNITATRTFVDRFYICLDALPTSDRILFSITAGASSIQVVFKSSDGKLYLVTTGSNSSSVAGVVVSPLIWYCIDIKAITTANPWLIDWKIESADQTQLTKMASAVDMTVVDYGIRTLGAWTVYYDDIVHSVTAADYPIGPGGTMGLSPIADGTHNNAANVMEDSSGNDINGTTYQAYPKLDDMPFSNTIGTDYIRQATIGTGNYCEVTFTQLAESLYGAGFIGVDALLQQAAGTTSADTGGCIIMFKASSTTVWGTPGALADYSETSSYYRRATVNFGGVDITVADINILKCRFGYSDDVTPNPYWVALLLEVGYRFPSMSHLVTNVSLEIEYKDTNVYDRVSNVALEIEYKDTTSYIRVSNVALMIEYVTYNWVPGPGVWIT